MIDLFISLGIPVLLFELTVLFFPGIYNTYLSEVIKAIKKGQLNLEDRAFVALNLFYIIWTIIGLFTGQWIYFLAILLLAILNSIVSKRNSEINRIKWRMVDSLATILLIIKIVFNHFG